MLACLAAGLAMSQGAPANPLLGLPSIPVNAVNPQSPEKIALGRMLFEDKQLSADSTVSCATCHKPDAAFADGRALARGFNGQTGTRNTPSLLNVAFFSSLFWDGRRPSLEAQALDPFVNPREHGLPDRDALIGKIRDRADYRAAFQAAFGIVPDQIAPKHVAAAIAVFERTLFAGDSAFDRYEYGGEQTALTPAARRGLELFRGRAQCVHCHTIGKDSALFTDDHFHSLGVGFKKIAPQLGSIALEVARLGVGRLDHAVLSRPEVSELGRFVVTLQPPDIGRFKTPSLRNVALTAPYMHDGSIATLAEAVDREVYYRGIEANRPLILTPAERRDLVAFLESLTSPRDEPSS